MSITTMHQEPIAAPRLAATLLPIMGVVFVSFLVIGAAMPVTHSAGDTSVALFGYFSYELPFRK